MKRHRWAAILLFSISFILVSCKDQEIRGQLSVEYLVNWNLEEFDPSTNWDGTSIALSNIYEPLLWFKSLNDFEPALAEKWDVSKDGLRWLFYIRKGVLFHNGKPLNAASVKYSIERTRALKQGASWIWDPVIEINILDDYRIEFLLKYQAPLDLIASSGYGAWIFSPNDNEGQSAENEVWKRFSGTGPYILKKVIPNQVMEFEYYSNYWQGWKDTTPRKARIRTVNESSTQIQMVLSGQSDILRQPPFDLIPYLEKNKKLMVVPTPSYENIVALLNVEKTPTNNITIRRAILHSIDFGGINKELLSNYGSIPTGLVVNSLWGPYVGRVKSIKEVSDYSLSAAKELLSSAFMPKEKKTLTLSLAVGDELLKSISILLQSSLRENGVELRVDAYPWPTQWERAKHLDTAPNIFLMYYWPTYPTPYDPLLAMFHTETDRSYNLSYYTNSVFDKMIDDANRMMGTNREAAIEEFIRAQDILKQDIPALSIADLQRVYIVIKRIKNFSINPAYPNTVFFHKLLIED